MKVVELFHLKKFLRKNTFNTTAIKRDKYLFELIFRLIYMDAIQIEQLFDSPMYYTTNECSHKMHTFMLCTH